MCFKITVYTPYSFFRQLTLQKLKTERKQKVGSARTNKLTAHISHLLVGKHELLFPQDMAPYSLEDATHTQQNERQVSANVLFWFLESIQASLASGHQLLLQEAFRKVQWRLVILTTKQKNYTQRLDLDKSVSILGARLRSMKTCWSSIDVWISPMYISQVHCMHNRFCIQR